MALQLNKTPTYKPFGKQAILIEWQQDIDTQILEDLLHFKEGIQKERTHLIVDFIVGYHSLTLKYKDNDFNYTDEITILQSIYKKDFTAIKTPRFLWEIPVCYDLEFGIDLEEMAQITRLSIDEIRTRHSAKIYTVFFIGFLPGFLYLGGLESDLFFDRKPTPRLKVPKGAVAIGGKQTGVYPSSSAGGWNLLGKTPINFFDVTKQQPCFAAAGDKIKFTPISLSEFHQLEKEVAENKYLISKTLVYD
jgi:inhibitor of KinA